MGKRIDQIRSELEKIRSRNRGRLTAEKVVQEARDRKHPLHGEFEWDDTVAAQRYRLDQARSLIRYCTIVVVETPFKAVAPFYRRDPNIPANVQGYCALTSDELDRADAEAIMLAELARCEAHIERARAVTALLDHRYPGLTSQLEDLLTRIVAMQERVTAAVADQQQKKRRRVSAKARA